MSYTTDTWTMAKISCTALFLIFSSLVSAQLAPGKYWISFTDKENSPYSLDAPEEYLSSRAIERRANQDIEIQITDLPVNPDYINQVLALGEMQLLFSSKWFNSIAVAPEDSTVLEQVAQLPFVSDIRSVQSLGHEEVPQRTEASIHHRDFEEYGISLHQISMLNGHLLHDAGFTGAGLRIGLMDGGFAGANEMEAFQPLIADGRLIGTWDFVDQQEDVFHSSTHGTLVWSAMASMWPDSIIGSAPEAEYMLFRTENVASEYQLEEVNWIAAAEMADSSGVDVLNTSLGYTTFDDSLQSYTYEDMDGQTTWISRAGNIAARKGMLVVNSAGNSGAAPWHYIGAPADADSVLAIGAVAADSAVVAFSSRGPSFDGRVKPNVCAQGSQTVMANANNTVIKGNGTSFSSPVLAGLAACLWQTNPSAGNMQVFAAIEQSAHLYDNPNDSLGYGLPNFFLAQSILDDMVTGTTNIEQSGLQVKAFPNPFNKQLRLLIKDTEGGTITCEVYDVRGRMVGAEQYNIAPGQSWIDMSGTFAGLKNGIYLIRIHLNGKSESIKVQKAD